MWIAVGGNVIDGFLFFGPFETEDDAREFAMNDKRMPSEDDWLVTKLQSEFNNAE